MAVPYLTTSPAAFSFLLRVSCRFPNSAARCSAVLKARTKEAPTVAPMVMPTRKDFDIIERLYFWGPQLTLCVAWALGTWACVHFGGDLLGSLFVGLILGLILVFPLLVCLRAVLVAAELGREVIEAIRWRRSAGAGRRSG